MAADPIIICLEKLTDYVEFEKLCCALLAHHTKYPQLVPMGGTCDGGRDAVVIHYSADKITGFAFSVRADWSKKFKSDARRLHETQGDKVKDFVYVSTGDVTASQHDEARRHVQDAYGWSLALFDIKWMRTQLVQPGSGLIAAHPSIFIPDLFHRRHCNELAFARDYLDQHAPLLDFVRAHDAQLAVEVDVNAYNAVCNLLQRAGVVEATCFNEATTRTLHRLHTALGAVWEVISDDNYIHPNPDSWRIKFDNDPSRLGCQKVLAAKKDEIVPLLEEFRLAYTALIAHAKDAHSLT